MSQATFEVAPAIINWVFEQLNIDDMNISVTENLLKWKNGEKKPTFNQIEKMSTQTNIPFGYFFLKQPPLEETPILECRTINSIAIQKPSRELKDTLTTMEDTQEWMRNHQISQGYSKLEVVGSLKDGLSADAIANKMKKDLDLNEEWYRNSNAWESFKYLRSKLQDIGILVTMNGVVGQNTHRPLNIEEFRGFTLIDEYAPLIFINASDSANGKLFTLLHEAVHVWFGSDSLYNDRYSHANNVSKLETICNAVAAEILVPKNAFVHEWELRNDITDTTARIIALSKLFSCGITVIARKALDNNFIDKMKYEDIAEEAVRYYNQLKAEKKASNTGGGSFYNNLLSRVDKHFILALNSSMYEGKTLFTDAYRITGTNRETFSTLVDKVRGVGL